ncbi:MAG: methylated-DNA--[protein]-cysteine S-methyltransferase [Polyangia bacterium]
MPTLLTVERLVTPIGTALLVTDDDGVLRAFNWTDHEGSMRAWLARHHPEVPLREGVTPVRDAFVAYFGGDVNALAGVPWVASGTQFQRKVWGTLCGIPAGETITYAELAVRIGKPSAVRAVGTANGANPVAVLVPCHRVIGSNGTLTGYGGGLPRKRWLLEHEGVAVEDERRQLGFF